MGGGGKGGSIVCIDFGEGGGKGRYSRIYTLYFFSLVSSMTCNIN